MKRQFIAMALAILSTTSIVAPSVEAKQESYGRWERLGARDVDLFRDRDVINVGRNRGGFRQIKLNVQNNAIHVESLVVVYANGAPDHIALRSIIRPHSDSRTIDLRGGAREIRRVEMVLRSVRNGKGKARVEIWARR